MLKTYKISITGQVQGVGFRPYVYSLATEFSLLGTVSNNEEGVLIFISGTKKTAYEFYHKLLQFPPPVSHIKNSSIIEIELQNFEGFKIHQFNKIQGLPFGNNELIAEFKKLVD